MKCAYSAVIADNWQVLHFFPGWVVSIGWGLVEVWLRACASIWAQVVAAVSNEWAAYMCTYLCFILVYLCFHFVQFSVFYLMRLCFHLVYFYSIWCICVVIWCICICIWCRCFHLCIYLLFVTIYHGHLIWKSCQFGPWLQLSQNT